jgi:transposase
MSWPGTEERQRVRVTQTPVTPEQRKAARREIVRQVEQGASAKVARVCSAVPMHRTTVYRLLKRVQSDEEKAFVDGRHGHAIKLRGEVLTFLTERCQTSSDLPSSALRCAIQEHFSLTVSISQLNRVRASLGLTRTPPAREKKAQKRLG